MLSVRSKKSKSAIKYLPEIGKYIFFRINNFIIISLYVICFIFYTFYIYIYIYIFILYIYILYKFLYNKLFIIISLISFIIISFYNNNEF